MLRFFFQWNNLIFLSVHICIIVFLLVYTLSTPTILLIQKSHLLDWQIL